jgi:hypothetical protein
MEKQVTTRELLRNFKTIKQELLNGKFEVITIAINDSDVLELKPKKTKGNKQAILNALKKLPYPIKIERPNIFEDFEENARKKWSKHS